MLVQIYNKARVIFFIKYQNFLILNFSWHSYNGLKSVGSTLNRRHLPHKESMSHHYMAAHTNKTSQTKKPIQNVSLEELRPIRIMKYSPKIWGLRHGNSLPKYYT